MFSFVPSFLSSPVGLVHILQKLYVASWQWNGLEWNVCTVFVQSPGIFFKYKFANVRVSAEN